MEQNQSTMAQLVAQAARDFHFQRTGQVPQAVSVVLSQDSLVITLHGALSPAENALAETPQGAEKVREFHRQFFADSAEPLRNEIKRITGVDVRQAAVEVETTTGAVMQVFTTGPMVQVCLLARTIPENSWSGPWPTVQTQESG